MSSRMIVANLSLSTFDTPAAGTRSDRRHSVLVCSTAFISLLHTFSLCRILYSDDCDIPTESFHARSKERADLADPPMLRRYMSGGSPWVSSSALPFIPHNIYADLLDEGKIALPSIHTISFIHLPRNHFSSYRFIHCKDVDQQPYSHCHPWRHRPGRALATDRPHSRSSQDRVFARWRLRGSSEYVRHQSTTPDSDFQRLQD